jgi:hypothetical protein
MYSQEPSSEISLCNNGPGFFGICVLSLVEALGIFNPVEWIEWLNFDAVLTIGFGLEYVYKMIEGTCYCKR